MSADPGRDDVLRTLEALDKVDVGVWKPSSSVPRGHRICFYHHFKQIEACSSAAARLNRQCRSCLRTHSKYCRSVCSARSLRPHIRCSSLHQTMGIGLQLVSSESAFLRLTQAGFPRLAHSFRIYSQEHLHGHTTTLRPAARDSYLVIILGRRAVCSKAGVKLLFGELKIFVRSGSSY